MEKPCGRSSTKRNLLRLADRRPSDTFLNGLYFNLFEDRTEVVATDAVQLALTHCEPLKLSEDKDGFIVPLKAVKEIERTFANAPEIKNFTY